MLVERQRLASSKSTFLDHAALTPPFLANSTDKQQWSADFPTQHVKGVLFKPCVKNTLQPIRSTTTPHADVKILSH